jgi:hypothetical protein
MWGEHPASFTDAFCSVSICRRGSERGSCAVKKILGALTFFSRRQVQALFSPGASLRGIRHAGRPAKGAGHGWPLGQNVMNPQDDMRRGEVAWYSRR